MTLLSKSSVGKLGERLRAGDEPSAEDRELLSELLAAHSGAFEEARNRILENVPHLDSVTGRLKSTPSIIEKLKRTPAMELWRMQDLAGIRIVVRGGRIAQSFAVDAVRGLFPESRIKDRLAEPQHGYRAVHVICKLERRWV